MTWHQRVIWSEGLFLQPHHFQQHDRYVEHQLRAHVLGTESWAWGTLSLALDPLALELGKIALTRGIGHLPDGTYFSFPDDAPAPAPLEIPSDARGETVLLALPLARHGAKEFDVGLRLADRPADVHADAYADVHADALIDVPHDLRYRMNEVEVADNVAGSQQNAHLQTATPNLRLMLARDATDAYATIGVARVLARGADRRVTLDPAYIPPALDVNRQPALDALLRDLCGLLHQHGENFAARFTQRRGGGVAEIADALLLMLVNRHELVFEHMKDMPVLHPARLFESMRALAGELATFDTRRRPGQKISYRHDALNECFGMLMKEIREAPGWNLPQTAQRIEMTEPAPRQRLATLHEPDLLKRAMLVFAARAQMPAEALRVRFPTQVKAAPAERIQEIVTLALPGIALRPLPTVPPQIPVHAGYDYFALEPDGDLWKQLEKSGRLAMHVLGDFPGLELECWAVRQ
ncbi:type VI secretion system baseplate subunit TssK [Caballeronia sp. BR00000012568055]|uniref:type VI secretion system baseplate subunit TssK n=1 Tax=Caballeronia sp. BR00000012568055 TaxID=2918761 RepID=UPI0023F8D785|nr:type VI secretion system baseplate subunit TssK [Caballeronia sp. BR00000012568055]